MPKWPKFNADLFAAITSSGHTLDDLRVLSPSQGADLPKDAETVIDALFPGNPLLCIGQTARQFNTRPREAWRGELSTLPLMVPSPMTTVWGRTQKGTPSQHTLSNTGARRFLVVEFDGLSVDHQAAILLHLATQAPLVMALHSGGKSIHGWFPCHAAVELHLECFFRYAVSLGGDPATWCRSQFVRIPHGTRENGLPQPVLYFNPKTLIKK